MTTLTLFDCFVLENIMQWNVMFVFAKFSFWGKSRKVAYETGGLVYMHGFIIVWLKVAVLWWQWHSFNQEFTDNRKEKACNYELLIRPENCPCYLETEMFSTDLVLIDLSLQYLSTNYRGCCKSYSAISTTCIIILYQLWCNPLSSCVIW